MALKMAVAILIPDTCDFQDEVKQRNRFIVQKHIYGFAADDGGASAAAGKGLRGRDAGH